MKTPVVSHLSHGQAAIGHKQVYQVNVHGGMYHVKDGVINQSVSRSAATSSVLTKEAPPKLHVGRNGPFTPGMKSRGAMDRDELHAIGRASMKEALSVAGPDHPANMQLIK